VNLFNIINSKMYKLISLIIGSIRLILFIILGFTFCFLFIIVSWALSKDVKPIWGISYRTFLLKFANWALGIRVSRKGEIPIGQCLLVSNHRSYIDATVILSENKVYAVSKEEVRKWPIIGYVAGISGTIFIGRFSSIDRKKGLYEIKNALIEKKSILNFIQGTTTIGDKLKKTKNGSIVTAYNLGIPIYPISIDYNDKSNYWIGKDRFVPHFFRTFGNLTTRVNITYHDRIEGRDINEVVFNVKKTINDGLETYRLE